MSNAGVVQISGFSQQHEVDSVMVKEPRKLTDADVEAIVLRLHTMLREEFFRNIGNGVWAMIWRTGLTAGILFAVYGVTKEVAK